MTSERRKFHRILFDAPAIIQNGQYTSKVIDISFKGILLQKPEGMEVSTGDQLGITVVLDQNADTTITMSTEVAHEESDSIGLRCRDIDMDSISHLRRLVELNLGDPELLERELENLG